MGPWFESRRAHSENPRVWGFFVFRAGDAVGRVATERQLEGVMVPVWLVCRDMQAVSDHPPSHSISMPLAVIVTLRSRAAARAQSVVRVGFGRLPASIRVRAAEQRKGRARRVQHRVERDGVPVEVGDEGDSLHVGVRSQKTKPSRSTISPVSQGMGSAKIGPAQTKVWNSPCSPQGSSRRQLGEQRSS